MRVLCLGLMPFLSFGQQDLEERLTQKVIHCDDVAMNSSEWFAVYVQEGQYDSARMVLDFWEENCGVSEPVQRANILLAILFSDFTEEAYDSTILDHVENFGNRVELSQLSNYPENYEYYAAYFGFVPLNSTFDKVVKGIAEGITPTDDLERLFCLLYAEKIDAFYRLLQKEKFKGTLVRKEYDKRVGNYKQMTDNHTSIALGTYVPTYDAALLGVHPSIGLSTGIKMKRLTLGVAMDFRFGATKENYRVLKSDTLTTDYFFGAYVGLDMVYQLLKRERNELLVLSGIGVDGFDTEFSSSNDEDIVSVASLNLNAGLMYRWYLSNRKYIGISYRYNVVNYNHDKIIEDLTGNFHSVAISFGWLNNPAKHTALNRLRYAGD